MKEIEEKFELLVDHDKLSSCDHFGASHVDEMFEIGYEYIKMLSIKL